MKRRETRQRKAILNILREADSHPTADWIYDEVRKIIPDISKGTVYRNLKILIFDLDEPVNSELDTRIAERTGFKVSYHQLEFRGLCNDCQGKTN